MVSRFEDRDAFGVVFLAGLILSAEGGFLLSSILAFLIEIFGLYLPLKIKINSYL